MPQNRRPALEICVESVEGLLASAGLADRIELCTALDLGGLSPSLGLMEQAKKSGIETHVLIRPRSGDFVMSTDDLSVAVADINAVKDFGLAGVVVGATKHGQLDTEALSVLLEAAEGLSVTLHRAFDVVEDQFLALETAITLGFNRILTSGGASSAVDGKMKIASLCQQAAGRIEIMAGASLTHKTVGHLLKAAPVDAVHGSCSKPVDQGAGLGRLRRVSREDIEMFRHAVLREA